MSYNFINGEDINNDTGKIDLTHEITLEIKDRVNGNLKDNEYEEENEDTLKKIKKEILKNNVVVELIECFGKRQIAMGVLKSTYGEDFPEPDFDSTYFYLVYKDSETIDISRLATIAILKKNIFSRLFDNEGDVNEIGKLSSNTSLLGIDYMLHILEKSINNAITTYFGTRNSIASDETNKGKDGKGIFLFMEKRIDKDKKWGIIPTVMLGGEIEFHDMRLVKNKDSNVKKIYQGKKLYISDPNIAILIEKMIRTNYKIEFPIYINISLGNKANLKYDKKINYELKNIDLNGFNIVGINLYDSFAINQQKQIEDEGYYFIALYPGNEGIYGIWAKKVEKDDNCIFHYPCYVVDDKYKKVKNCPDNIDSFLNQELIVKDFIDNLKNT